MRPCAAGGSSCGFHAGTGSSSPGDAGTAGSSSWRWYGGRHPTFLLPDKIAESKDGKLSVWAEAYNGIMGSQAVSEHRPVIDKVFGSSLHLFRTATNRYDNFRTPEQKRLYVSAGMAEGCTVQQLNEVVRHMENYISRFDQVDMFRTRITSYDNAQIEITFKPEFEYGPFPAMLKQELTSAAINFGGATWYIRGIDDNTFNNNVVNNYRSNQFRLKGYNYDQLSAYADALIDTLSRNRRVSNPEIMDGNAWSLPHNEFNIRYDDERIAAAGLDVADYYGMLSTMLFRSRLSPVYNGEELQQVVLESGDRDRFDPLACGQCPGTHRLAADETRGRSDPSKNSARASPSAATGSRIRYWSGTISSGRTNLGGG